MIKRDDENEAQTQAQASSQVEGEKTNSASQSDATEDDVSGYVMAAEEDELQTFFGRH